MSFLLSVCMFFSAFAISLTPVEVIASSCYLYQSPSFESEKVTEDGVDLILEFGQKLTLLVEEEDFALVQTATQQIGYIYKYYIAKEGDFELYPSFNGAVRAEKATIYNMNFEPTSYKASAGQRVFLYQGFDSEEDFVAVQIVLEDGSLYNGYMLKADIEPDGISATLIVGITIIVAVATIILSLLFIKKKKKKSGSKD